MRRPIVTSLALLPLVVWAASKTDLSQCPGYKASNVKTSDSGLTADLSLAGTACNVYGTDLQNLTLTVEYQTDSRLHVKIQDAANDVYQIPEFVLPRTSGKSSASSSALNFSYVEEPFSFVITRSSTGESLFNTSAASLIFETQYVRLRTYVPENPNLYGLGEHTDPFKLNSTNYIRTLWSQDNYGIPSGTNLYGNHPVYYDHRLTGTHGVFLANSNGMDIKINNSAAEGQYLEYSTLGGVLDFYFLAGPGPLDVAEQYSDITGQAAMMPYWGFGFHQCRYGYQDAYNTAEVVYNYSQANIPLETMWNDIDYMDGRKVFSLDPDRFPLHMVQELVDHLHANDQHYIMMVDPAVAYQQYGPLERGDEAGIFLKRANGSDFLGVVWPGVTVFPDWFHENITDYWNGEFEMFFDPTNGVDIDALWIDMNEPSNFGCQFPCDNPFEQAVGYPPTPPAVRTPPRPLPGWPCDFQPEGCSSKAKRYEKLSYGKSKSMPKRSSIESFESLSRRQPSSGTELGLPGRDLLYPEYAIHNSAAYTTEGNAAGGGLSNHTVNTDIIHQNGLAMYDTHNLFGTMMSSASRDAMVARRPSLRPMIITRSTFAGAGSHVGHWLGDTFSDWAHYRVSITGLLQFASLYQVPMVGSDVCGFAQNTTEQLCARWAMLGAFSPFYRNHNDLPPVISQEFYRWDSVAEAARKVIDLRYRLLDYFYTEFYIQSTYGTPSISPMWFFYPQDSNTFAVDLQYFYGSAVLISPVTEEDATSVSAYFPKDIFYNAWTYAPYQGTGAYQTIDNLGLTDIPVHFRGGSILAMREKGANTTTVLRETDFDIVVAQGTDGKASGKLYLDDGVSLVQSSTTQATFAWDGSELTMSGTFGYETKAQIASLTLLGVSKKPGSVMVGGTEASLTYNATTQVLRAENLSLPLSKGFTATFSS